MIPSFRSNSVSRLLASAALATALLGTASQASTVVPVSEDVMTSSFFLGANSVRGYAGDNRPVFRVSTDGAFGLSGAETIYLSFADVDFSPFSTPVEAWLTVQAAPGGQGADASAENPFTVTAHGVSADPLSTIKDDTNPAGAVTWLNFYNQNILAADAAAYTVVTGSGEVRFNVSALVNRWIAGSNTVQAVALTGRNDTSGQAFLQGFMNNTQAPGSTFLTVTAVPEPAEWALMIAGLGIVGAHLRGRASRGNRAAASTLAA